MHYYHVNWHPKISINTGYHAYWQTYPPHLKIWICAFIIHVYSASFAFSMYGGLDGEGGQFLEIHIPLIFTGLANTQGPSGFQSWPTQDIESQNEVLLRTGVGTISRHVTGRMSSFHFGKICWLMFLSLVRQVHFFSKTTKNWKNTNCTQKHYIDVHGYHCKKKKPQHHHYYVKSSYPQSVKS